MAFTKTAFASTEHASMSWENWSDVRSKGSTIAQKWDNRVARTTMMANADPSKFLLSHATIVSSVDTENGPGPLGPSFVDGFQINRNYQDFYIVPKTLRFANNNHDAFERRLLLSCFRTFIGGENYVEHLQIPEMSKGKILDAVARDIGDSIYIDILIATDRKHKPLIAEIEGNRLKTLSMGAQVLDTTCTRCGNTAHDDTQLCPHVKYLKGQKFHDHMGQARKVIELCGHYTRPASVKFIEASWVGHPAFEGAERRPTSALSQAVLEELAQRTLVAFPINPLATGGNKTAAFQDQGEGQDASVGMPSADPEVAPADPLSEVVDELSDAIKNKSLQKVKDELQGPPKPRADMNENINDTMFHQSAKRAFARLILSMEPNPVRAKRLFAGLMCFHRGGWMRVSALQLSSPEILTLSSIVDQLSGVTRVAGEHRLYDTVKAVGGVKAYDSERSFLAACRRVLGRDLLPSDEDLLVAKGRLFDLGR